MRIAIASLAVLAAGITALPAQATTTSPRAVPTSVDMQWVAVGGAGNAPDKTVMASDRSCCYGSVPYDFRIGTYDVTTTQYAAFLNAVASKSDPYVLYFPCMDVTACYHLGAGIARTGSPGAYVYTAQPGREKRPINYLNVFMAMRFANWMNNGEGSASTETGAYTLRGGTIIPTNALTIRRNPGVKVWLPSEDEWYKAAYYDAKLKKYYAYPGGTSTPMQCALPSAAPNTANCGLVTAEHNPANPGLPSTAGWFYCDTSDVGAYTGTKSPSGAYDMGGNVFQWTDTFTDAVILQYQAGSNIKPLLDAVDQSVGLPFSNTGPLAVVRGTDFGDAGSYNAADNRSADVAADPFETYGMRMATIAAVAPPAAAPVAKPVSVSRTSAPPATGPAVSAPHGSLAATGVRSQLTLLALGLMAAGALVLRRRRV